MTEIQRARELAADIAEAFYDNPADEAAKFQIIAQTMKGELDHTPLVQICIRHLTAALSAQASRVAAGLDPEVKDWEVEAALVGENIRVWGPDGERFERMFAVVMQLRREALGRDGDGQ